MTLGLLLPILAVAVILAVVIAVIVRRQSGSAPGSSNPERLAQLLVTELKLYNGDLVEEARREGAIYRRLHDEIERSRRMFEDRTPAQERGDHFDRALVEILAGGDASAMGPRQTMDSG